MYPRFPPNAGSFPGERLEIEPTDINKFCCDYIVIYYYSIPNLFLFSEFKRN